MANEKNEKSWHAWVWIKWMPGTPSNAWETWSGNKAILSAWSTQGEWDSCLWVDVSTPAELEEFVWKTIRGNKWVASTSTSWAKRWW